MRRIAYITIAVWLTALALVLGASTRSAAQVPSGHPALDPDPAEQPFLASMTPSFEVPRPAPPALRLEIIRARRATWACQSWLGEPRTPTSRLERRPRTLAQHRRALGAWRRRASACATRKRGWLYRDASIHHAIPYAARISGADPGWLHSCAHSEGGHVSSETMRRDLTSGKGESWNNHGFGSDAFGNWQFMLGTHKGKSKAGDWGTFDRMIGWARSAFARRVPPRFLRVDSVVGQTLAAAAGYVNGRSGEWSGAGC